MTSEGVTYDEHATMDISTTNNYENDGKVGGGIRVSEERWEKEYFTIPYEESHNKNFDKKELETGQIVALKEDRSMKNCPYRVERTDHDDYVEIILKSCHGGSPEIKLVSRGQYGFKWTMKRNGTEKSGHAISTLGISDEFLVEQLDAEQAYVSHAI